MDIIGIIALKDELRSDCYLNFLKLSAAIKILSDKDLLEKYLLIAQGLINEFVCEFEDIYGLEHCVFNIHVLTHLADDCKIYGVVAISPVSNMKVFYLV